MHIYVVCAYERRVIADVNEGQLLLTVDSSDKRVKMIVMFIIRLSLD